MEYTKIKGVNKDISRIVLGTMHMSLKDEKGAYEILDTAYECGITAYDCAPVYSGGDSEVILGRWIKNNSLQDKVFVITKCAHPSGYRTRANSFDILSDLHDSFARTKLDSFDLYFLHRDDKNVPVGHIVETLNRIYDEGKIKSFGGSNWEHERIEQANEYAAKYGLKGFQATSPNYSLVRQLGDPWGAWGGECVAATGDDKKAARDYYAKESMPIFAYSSLGHGMLSGRVNSASIDEAKKALEYPAQVGYLYEENLERLRRAEILAAKYSIKVPQVALAWLLCRPLNVLPIIGALTPSEVKENVLSFDVKLSDKEQEWLDLKCEM